MTGIEDVLRAELAREAASLDYAPDDGAWAAITKRAEVTPTAGTGHGGGERGGAFEPARQRPRGWLMVAGSAAAVVVTVLAGTYAGGVYGPSGHRTVPGPASSTGQPGPPASSAVPSPAVGVPSAVVRVAPPPGQPGITMYAWSLTYKVLANPADLKAGMSPAQIAKLPTRTITDLCMSDQPPSQAPPRIGYTPTCPVLAYLGVAVDHTPRIGFPVSGGDTWIGTATANVGSVEARYADGRVVRSFIATIPGSDVRVWSLGLSGPQRVGNPLPGVSLVLRDAHGKFLGQGTLSASLPNQFPFASLHGTVVQLFPFETAIEAAITAWGKYAVFGYYQPEVTGGNLVSPASTSYPLPTRLPLQGEFGMSPGFLHPWWFGLARADVAQIAVRLADGRTMRATCPSPAPAPVIPSKIPHGGGSLTSKHLVATCAAIPGAPGGERAFAIQLPQEFYRKTAALPQGTATAYDAAGKVLATTPLGTVFTH
jgi:hypothetical protein